MKKCHYCVLKLAMKHLILIFKKGNRDLIILLLLNILLLFVGNDCHLLKKYYFLSDLEFCFIALSTHFRRVGGRIHFNRQLSQ